MGSAELDGFLSRMGVMGFYPLGIWFVTLIAWILKSFMFMLFAILRGIGYAIDYNQVDEQLISCLPRGEAS